MNGVSSTKEIAKKEASEIENLISKWVEARDNQNYKEQGEIHLFLQDKFQNVKGLLSVLRSFQDDDEASQIISSIESQQKHFHDLEESEKQAILSNASKLEETDETTSFLGTLRIASQEVDNALSQQIEVLKKLEEIETEGFSSISTLVPRVKQINTQTNQLYLLVFIMVILFVVFYTLYYIKK